MSVALAASYSSMPCHGVGRPPLGSILAWLRRGCFFLRVLLFCTKILFSLFQSEQCFSLTTNQRTVLLAMTFQRSERGLRCLQMCLSKWIFLPPHLFSVFFYAQNAETNTYTSKKTKRHTTPSLNVCRSESVSMRETRFSRDKHLGTEGV
jgi:hypothetical protein